MQIFLIVNQNLVFVNTNPLFDTLGLLWMDKANAVWFPTFDLVFTHVFWCFDLFCIWTQIWFGFYACILMFWCGLYLDTDLIWFLRMYFDVLICFVFEHRLDLVFTHVFWCFDLVCIWTQIRFGFYACVLMFWFGLYLDTDLIWFLRMCFDVLMCFVFGHRLDLVFTHVFWCFDVVCIWTQIRFGFYARVLMFWFVLYLDTD